MKAAVPPLALKATLRDADDGPVTIQLLVNAFITGRVRRREITAATARRERTVLRAFATSYGARQVRNMSRSDIERWLAGRSHLAAGTRRNEFSIVRAFTRWLQRERRINRDPMLDVRPPKVPRSVPRALSDVEVAAVWSVLPDLRARAIMALLDGLALRRCEVLALEVGDWDRAGETLRVVGKGSHERVLPVPADVASALDAYLTSIRAFAGPMIRTGDGTRGISNSWLGKLMRTWMEEAGVKHAPGDGRACHSLRHTRASKVVDAEPDLRVAQELLGHASITSTQIYLRRAGLSKLRAALERAA